MSYVESVKKVFSFQVITLILTLFLGVFTSRILNPEGRGQIALAVVLVSIIEMIFRNGSEVACMNMLHKMHTDKTRLVNNVLTLAFTFGAIGTALSIIFFDEVQFLFNQKIEFQLFLLIAPRIIFSMLTIYLKNIFLAENLFDKSNMLDILLPTSNIFIVAGLLIFQQVSVKSILLGGTIATALPMIWGLMAIQKIHRWKPVFDKSIWSDLLHYGVKGHASSLLDFFNARIDLILVSYFLGIQSVGLYSLAQMAERLQLIPNTFAQALLAKMSIDRKHYSKMTPIICRNTLFITAVLSTITAIGGLLIPIVYGEPFRDSVSPFVILTFGTCFIAITKTLKSYIYIYMERPELSTYASMVNLAVNILLNLFLIPRMGIAGAAAGATLGFLFYALMHLIPFIRHSRVSILECLILKKSDLSLYLKFFNTLRK